VKSSQKQPKAMVVLEVFQTVRLCAGAESPSSISLGLRIRTATADCVQASMGQAKGVQSTVETFGNSEDCPSWERQVKRLARVPIIPGYFICKLTGIGNWRPPYYGILTGTWSKSPHLDGVHPEGFFGGSLYRFPGAQEILSLVLIHHCKSRLSSVQAEC
jgi:hypothetical protein